MRILFAKVTEIFMLGARLTKTSMQIKKKPVTGHDVFKYSSVFININFEAMALVNFFFLVDGKWNFFLR